MPTRFTVPTTQVYTHADTGVRRRFVAGTEVNMATAVKYGMAGAALDAAETTFTDAEEGFIEAQMIEAAARTATADGTGTGAIAAGTDIVTVTSADANHIITLPPPTPGVVVVIVNGATGYELRSTDPASVSINGGAGANAESAIAATMVVVARCVSATRWIAMQHAAAGTQTAVEAAA